MATHRVETRLNEITIRELDRWRSGRTPSPSRSEAVRLLLEERLCGERPEPHAARSTRDRCPAVDRLAATYVLERVSGFGPVKFREMHDAGVDPQVAIENPDRLPFRGRTGDKLRSAIRTLSNANAIGRTRPCHRATEARERMCRVNPCTRRPGVPKAGLREQQSGTRSLRPWRPRHLERQQLGRRRRLAR